MLPMGRLAHPPGDLPVQVRQLRVQDGDHPLDAGQDNGAGHVAALEFRGAHLDHLATAGSQGRQVAVSLGGGRLGGDRCHLAVAGNDEGVQAVGLGQDALGAGEVPHGPGIHHGHGQAGFPQEGGCQGFVAAGGFQGDEGRVQGQQAEDQGSHRLAGVGDPPRLPRRMGRDVQPVFGHVNADETPLWGCHTSSLRPCLVDAGSLRAPATVRAPWNGGWGDHAEARSADLGQSGLPHPLPYYTRTGFDGLRANGWRMWPSFKSSLGPWPSARRGTSRTSRRSWPSRRRRPLRGSWGGRRRRRRGRRRRRSGTRTSCRAS